MTAPRASRADTIISMFPMHGAEMIEQSHYGMFRTFAFSFGGRYQLKNKPCARYPIELVSYSGIRLIVRHVTPRYPLTWSLPVFCVRICPTSSGSRHPVIPGSDRRIQAVHVLCECCLLQPNRDASLVMRRYGRTIPLQSPDIVCG